MNNNQASFNDSDDILDNCKKSQFLQLSNQEFNSIKQEFNHYENIRSVSIEALKIIQKHRGWVSDNAIFLISRILRISVSDVEGVATFYNQIFRQPVGKYIIRYCDSVVCYITGCAELKEALENILDIKIGNTTEDKVFTLLPTCCLGMCNVAPVIMINEDIHANVIPSEIRKLLSLYK